MRLFLLLPVLLLWTPALAVSADPTAKPAPPPALVRTDTVTLGTVRTPVSLIGTAEPRRVSEVASETAGLVESLEVRRGKLVKQGAPLVRMRPVRQKLLLDQAVAERGETEARLVKAEDDARRAGELFAKNFISPEELQTRTVDREVFRRQLGRIDATIALLEDRLERLTIRAPFSGQVVAEKCEAGQWLDEGDAAMTLADLGEVRILVPVPEQQITAVKVGDEVVARFDALPHETFSARVAAVVPQADVASRSFPVEIRIANPKGRILSGMLGRVTFPLGSKRQAALIPKDALIPQPDGGSTLVRVVNGQAEILPVRLLTSVADRYAVEPLQGELGAGDRVVTRGNERLRNGQAVAESQAD